MSTLATHSLAMCEPASYIPIYPYIPAHLCYAVFQQLHGFIHPGVGATKQLVTTCLVWLRINADIVRWIRACVLCQRFRMFQHMRPPLLPYTTPTGQFHNVHVDVMGPFPRSYGYLHVLTVVDCYTHWIEAAPTVAYDFLHTWVPRFGCPASVITGHGVQFTSALFTNLARLLSTVHYTTAAYHPSANEMVGRALQLQPVMIHHAGLITFPLSSLTSVQPSKKNSAALLRKWSTANLFVFPVNCSLLHQCQRFPYSSE